jgi:succinyl-diaminopimelate desuccinylase
MVNKVRLIKLIQHLIQIDSQNPPGDESRIAKFVAGYLKGLGLLVKTHEFKKNRINVVAKLFSKGKKKSLLITPHLDTVPAGKSWKHNPFLGKIKQGKIFGLGATDCKGNLACSLEAINSLQEEGVVLDYNLIFAATADEETGSSLGLIPLLQKKILHPDAALVLDADDFHIVVTQKGLIHLKIKLEGRKAHGAYPWLGLNAINLASEIIDELKKFKFKVYKNKYLRSPTVNIGTIKGGDKVNVVADWCEFEVDLRFLPGDSSKEILFRLGKLIKKHAKKFKIEIEGIQKAYSIEAGHPLVHYLVGAMKKERIRPLIKGSEGATVITFFQDKNIAAIATGFGYGGCAHSADEFVKINSLYKGTLVLERFLKEYNFKG